MTMEPIPGWVEAILRDAIAMWRVVRHSRFSGF